MERGFRIEIPPHGFVRLVDYMGSDEAVIEAARMSTGRGFEGWGPGRICRRCRRRDGDIQAGIKEGDYGKAVGACGLSSTASGPVHDMVETPGDLKLLADLYSGRGTGRAHACYDEKTEVLTKRGFVAWPSVESTDYIGCWDPILGSLVYEKPSHLVELQYEGPLCRVDHAGVDLLVTPNHRMWVSLCEGRSWLPWQLVEAHELCRRQRVRYQKCTPYRGGSFQEWPLGITSSCSNAFGRLLGFFLGDGSVGVNSANCVSFHLKKNRKIKFLLEAVTELGWRLTEGACFGFSVHAPDCSSWFREACYAPDREKRIPEWVFEAPLEFQRSVLAGLRNSDGSQKRGAWCFSTSSPWLSEQFERLALHCGEAVSANKSQHGNTRLMVLSRMREPMVNHSDLRHTTHEYYNGKVYCATVRTGLVVVRRNGKIVISGNSPFGTAGAIHLEIQAPIFVFRQIHRHRTQMVVEDDFEAE